MDKINLGVDEVLYYEKLDNGLEIFMIPNKKVKNTYATFTTKYGSSHDEFVPINESKMVKVPLGIAHFLEHKMFEQEDGIDPFTFYSKSGTNSNAHTSLKNTTYEFSGPNNFLENLEFLIDFVQSPYLTDENVEKEKGIIEQELKMYLDDPFWSMYDGIRENCFTKNPTRYPIGGTVESIKKIDKKELYRCYNTFYHPSNMFIVITGNFDVDETVNLIRENQLKKDYKKMSPIKLKSYKEVDKVLKEKTVVNKNTDTPKLAYGIKINTEKLGIKDKRKEEFYLYILFELLFGITSLFNEEELTKGYLSSSISIDRISIETHTLVILLAETLHPEELSKEIDNKLKNITIEPNDLEMLKRSMISSRINLFDNIINLNDAIVNNIIEYGMIDDTFISFVDELNMVELNNIIKKIDLTNTLQYIVMPFE